MNEKLQTIDIFKTLNNETLNEIASISQIKKLSKDNVLFYEGDEPDYFYCLITGNLKVFKMDLKGQEIVLHYFTKPTLVAEMPSLEDMPFPATAVAMGDSVEVLCINQKKFLNMLQGSQTFSFSLVKSLTKKVKNLELVINRKMVYDAITNVASFIQENPNIMKNSKNKDIASILNMAPETFSRTLAKLRKLEIIDTNNEIIDNEKLSTIIDI